MTRQVDHSALRTNQVFIIGGLLIAFVLELPVLVAFVATVMIIGTLVPQAALFKRIYRHLLRPLGLVKPDIKPDNPEPHRFAQGLGGVVTLIATVALYIGVSMVGWAAAWLVIVLAALNLFGGFCAGCFVYYQLSQQRVPGFTVNPVRQE
jgi:hypothetical protein